MSRALTLTAFNLNEYQNVGSWRIRRSLSRRGRNLGGRFVCVVFRSFLVAVFCFTFALWLLSWRWRKAGMNCLELEFYDTFEFDFQFEVTEPNSEKGFNALTTPHATQIRASHSHFLHSMSISSSLITLFPFQTARGPHHHYQRHDTHQRNNRALFGLHGARSRQLRQSWSTIRELWSF